MNNSRWFPLSVARSPAAEYGEGTASIRPRPRTAVTGHGRTFCLTGTHVCLHAPGNEIATLPTSTLIMRKCFLFVLSLTVFLCCAFFLPDVFGWGQHRHHAALVRQVAAPTVTLPDGKER